MQARHSFAVPLAVLLAWFAPSAAHACKCGLPPVAVVAYPVFDGPQQLERVEERVWIDCGRDACRLRARLVVRNHAAAEVRTFAHFSRSHAETFGIVVDGVRRSLADSESSSPAIRRALNRLVPYANVGEVDTSRAEVRIAAGASMTIEIDSSLDVEPWSCGCGDWGVRNRHLVVTPESYVRQLAFVRVSDMPATNGAALTASITAPGRESVTVSSFRGSGERRESADLSPAPNAARPETFVLEGHDAEVLFVDLDWSDDAHVLPGGPLLGVGGGFGDQRGLRLRAGYEFAFPQYVAYAAVVESDAKRHVAVIPSVELVPPWVRVLDLFPMPSIGVGAPVQVWPRVRGGFRGQAGLGWFFFTVLGSVDIYPATSSDPRILRGALVAQFSI